jgi:hypothetical protein
MIGRSRRVALRSGIEFETPLLVPALSSIAISPIPYAAHPQAKPQLTPCSIVHSETLVAAIDEALLLSAYDIGNKLLIDSDAFKSGFLQSRYAGPRLLVIDCGWYEKDGGPLGNPFAEGVDAARPWGEVDFLKTLDDLDENINAIVVSWDHEGSYAEQIQHAQRILGARSRFSSAILLKRPGESRFHDFEKLSGTEVASLRAFDVIGVTEKELGETILNRLLALAKLRMQLDDRDVSAPIHVFGGLDPLFTPLYFAAGGEIFDGVGWLRYSYRDGVATSMEAGALLSRQIDKRLSHRTTTLQLNNLDVLRELAGTLRVFSQLEDWTKLHRGGDLEPMYDRMQAELGRHRGR